MKTNFYKILAVFFILSMMTLACNLTDLGVTQSKGFDEVSTAAAQTVEVRQTQSAFGTMVVGQLTQIAQTLPVTQPQATQQMAATYTPYVITVVTTPIVITATPVPATATPVPPTATAIPASTSTNVPPPPPPPQPTQVPCNWVKYVTDITIPDGTEMNPEETFTKVWRLQNIGTCVWSPDYSIVFISGNAMGAKASQPINATVYPGQMIDVAISMTAPEEDGNYTGSFQLRSANGITFGIGAQASKSFWANIVVSGKAYSPSSGTALDFVYKLCSARWKSNKVNPLPCPGSADEFDDGAVYRTNYPKIEKGYQDDEGTIVVIPANGDGGFTSAEYPAITVKDGYHFWSRVGCMSSSPNCSVEFYLKYRVEDGSLKTLGSWVEKYDGNTTEIEEDLSFLAGKSVKFYLVVDNHNGSSHDDRAFWMVPRILK